jgi:nicotinate-nucleotide adenylyltransferase
VGWAPLGIGTEDLASGRSSGAWGVLGGTFDPIHHAHLAIAEHAREALDLAGVLFVPAGIPPHKPDRSITAPAHRVAMVELAIADNPCFHLSRVEIDRPGTSYAVETLDILSRDTSDLVFILSVEALKVLPGWREPSRILELCRLAVVPRRGYRPPARAWLAEHFPGQEDRVLFLDGPDLGHSATEIRRLASMGRSIRYLVPDAVAAYVRDQRLYPPELWAKN